ncbi:class F sortase [Streptomyces tibetensis]|uniref:class F sortase n=1 Tax=Streptomyces tibetensis TaxID=2382123 RepID=UPI0033D9E1E0
MPSGRRGTGHDDVREFGRGGGRAAAPVVRRGSGSGTYAVPARRYAAPAGVPGGWPRRARRPWYRTRAFRLTRTIAMTLSLLVVAGVCWDRGEEPGATAATALPPDFTTAAHPAGSGTPARPGTSGTGNAAVPKAPGTAAFPAGPANPTPGRRTGPAEAPASATTPARPPGSPRTTGSATPGGRAPGAGAPGPASSKADAPGARATGTGTGAPGLRGAKPATPPGGPAAATPRPAPRPAAPAVRKPRPPAGLRPLPRSRATRLLIPYLDLDAPVMDLGLDRDRRLTAPPDDDPRLVGWYRHGASPGEQGTAVAVGHLDTDSGPAVFAGLTELKRGRIIKARRADGRIAVYTVDGIKSYEKAHFPSKEVYGARGRPELRLITCGGNYDRRKGYSGNLVVFAHLTGIR